ncbi:MAG: nucleoside-diphosphate kinase [Candidatus Edwardsbacteria bacterium RIFOXYD12_FULL_50_11]|jgi:nucleoside-diphosphate kinase|uniref:Nucleoside diphosphate kinase n=1 Tax=Candidatus Edwardsbacteria bacterium GWF2_54_11 TaxID=1817851 RepID=A0A1F5R4S1_9BACT|nr:MAG: nucleoside-diphosphate kinase [Candidatus Edwardsbacteria bacterium RifOxyC12_full_54_24]OGF06659.1 MAG: nucleoside-diphosphate kinase [Candidatus Edwardsbacteria bacterium RifOxyA12_full_54_48]OGF09426.1 MAG: nucleoside-diphosphate kinase [Candidatus Edwardsbacteria bacterium GWF2_54_11]OGF10610.1 MAG: nucleoside-diphosphate kinase [Candidatus Edwardsbacteria bacterium GWE2_54_12]OGF17041.1 MAG: nucleoside-diphosphate kinase [Candidatus Edwardsbacteria bacterium RIFOXYD12_FULL_50_11]O
MTGQQHPKGPPERTLMIIKPDAVERGLIGEILHRVELDGFQIIAMKMIKMTESQAKGFYRMHRKKNFYKALVKFMTSDPSVLCVLERENAIANLRQLVGSTNPDEAAFGTIRHDYATATRFNCVHASDSPESAKREVHFFFRESAMVRIHRRIKRIYSMPFARR